MQRKKCSLGLDIGTTSVKAIALNDDGIEIARFSQRIPMIVSDEGVAEQDAGVVCAALTDVFASCVRQAVEQGYDVAHIGFSSAMHSLLAVNQMGEPLVNAITWMDTRAKHDAANLWNSDSGATLYERTGTPIHAMSPLCKLAWLNRTQPNLVRTAYKFVSLKEFVWHRWFGEWCVDESIASATGLFNLQTRDWDCEALSVAGISVQQLSTLVPTTYRKTGVRDTKLINAGLSADSCVTIGASDGVLANLGVGVLDSDSLVMTVGTSLALRTGSIVPVTNKSFRPFCYVLDGTRFVIGGPSNSGGILLDWLYRQIFADGVESSVQGLEELLTEAGNVQIGDLVCIPYVAGERAPLWDEDAKASFVGLQLFHRSVHLVRAAVEGIIYNAYSITLKLYKETGLPKSLVISGNLFETDWVRQFVANVFDLPVVYYEGGDASTIGAVILAHQAAGEVWQGEKAYRSRTRLATVVPDKTTHKHEMQRLTRFQKITERVLHE